MRNPLRFGPAAYAFLLICVPAALAQGQDDPIDSGVIVPPSSGDRVHTRTIYARTDFYIYEEIRRNGVLKEWTDAIILTTCDVVVSVRWHLGTYGLQAGDILDTNMYVEILCGPHAGRYTWDTTENPVARIERRWGRREDGWA